MKIYTKKGDEGKTSLLGGTKVSKSDIHLDAYGTVDELNSFIGLLRDYMDSSHYEYRHLLQIQEQLFELGSELAQDPQNPPSYDYNKIKEEDILGLEKSIDTMDKDLPKLQNFIVPGGLPASSNAHICRTVCRRAERKVVILAETEELRPLLQKYLNRLSDYFFVLARHLNHDAGIEDIKFSAREDNADSPSNNP